MVKTLRGAIIKGKRLACEELMGGSEPFTAIYWMRTLPEEWQPAVFEAILDVYQAETG